MTATEDSGWSLMAIYDQRDAKQLKQFYWNEPRRWRGANVNGRTRGRPMSVSK